MDFDPSRLRRGEWIVGAGAVVLLASMFVLQWYGVSGQLGPTAAPSACRRRSTAGTR